MPSDGFRSILTDVQGYAAGLLRKLLCARHDQLHWLISHVYPDVTPEKVMHQLKHIMRTVDDGRHYLWPGCELNTERITAVDIMLRLCGGSLPIFDTARSPCALVFFLTMADRMQPFRVYTPMEGKEAECRAIAENQREPKGHAVVFYVQDKRQIPLLHVSHPHIFAVSGGAGGFTFQDAKL